MLGQSPHILDNKYGVFMPEKNTNSATIEQKCNNKKELSVIEHFDTDANLNVVFSGALTNVAISHRRVFSILI